jgi:hypothetical protein
MLRWPKVGDVARISYGKRTRAFMPLHGRIGRIVVSCRAMRGRNHGVEIDGELYAIPAGNLFLVE